MTNPTVFTTDRLLEFTSVNELAKLVGSTASNWPIVAIKEIIDNALDACEDADIAPAITVEISAADRTIVVRDNGPGIAPDVVERLADLRTKTSSREAYVAPTRGAQGNALQSILAMPFALDGEKGRTVIEAFCVAHTIEFTIDHVHRVPRVRITRSRSFVQNGTAVTLLWPNSSSSNLGDAKDRIVQIARGFAFLNPHATFRLTWDGTTMVKAKTASRSWRKWRPGEPAPAAWYGFESFSRRIAASVAHDLEHGRHRTLREFIAEFRGCARSDTQKEILDAVGGARLPLHEFFREGHNAKAVYRLLEIMQESTKPVAGKELGVLGKEHFESCFHDMGIVAESFSYKRVLTDAIGGFPYVLETAFAYHGSECRQQILGLNFSPRSSDPFTDLFGRERGDEDDEDGEDDVTDLDALLTHQRISAKTPVVFALHLACPHFAFTDKGKTRLTLPSKMNGEIVGAVEHVTKRWAKTIKAEERDASARTRRLDRLCRSHTISIKHAAWEAMEDAYMAASDNDSLPANARQVMYAARIEIQERTGKQLNDAYFTQTLLPDYIAENGVGWDVVYDDRGHFREPHTGTVIGLGTLAVRDYLATAGKPKLQGLHLKPANIETRGPHGCFSAVMFVEKEGFEPLWQSVDLAERYDLAIMSTKGMSVTACRQLADEMCGKYGIPLLVLHDFDKSGFSTIGTLREATRRYTYENEISVIDLGLRLADIDGLQSEDVFDRGNEDARRSNLRKNGATNKEIEFLLHRRVELNAMTSRQLVDFVERKLRKHGIGKVIPNKEELAEAYRLFVRGREMAQIIEPELARLNGGSRVQVPANLRKRVIRYLALHPTARWDEAVAVLTSSNDT
jgi:DNA topoisomerase VI subunit B